MNSSVVKSGYLEEINIKMITMIKKIKDIGIFKNYEAKYTKLKKDFSKVNLIYGLNTYGKSTLCDILKDVSDNTNERIKERLSIPICDSPEVIINSDIGSSHFSINKWTSNQLKNKILVFDDEFVMKNVFSGIDLIGDRKTKENFTDFILGDKGVQIAKEIEQLKYQQKEIKIDIERNIPPSQHGKMDNDIKKYLNMNVVENLNELNSKKQELEKKVEIAKRRIDNIEKMRKYQNFRCEPLSKIKSLIEKIKELCNIWKKTFNISSGFVIGYQEYLNKRFNNDSRAEQWLSQGLKYLNGEDQCPLCGQNINKSNIVKTLKEVLGNDYQEYKEKIILDLENIQIQWNVLELSKNILIVRNKLENAKKIFGEEINIFDKELSRLYIEAEVEEKKLERDLDYLQKLKRTNDIIKRALPGNPVEFEMDIDKIFNRYNNIWNHLAQCIKEINVNLNEIRNNTEKEKRYNKTEIDNSKEIELIKQKICRLRENRECVTLNELYNKKRFLELSINNKNQELEENQNIYLTNYFNSINRIFKKYGAKKFEIRKGELSRRGNRSIIGIKVLFDGVSINSKDTPRKIFSESDKRALAMSVFMAKIENMPNDKKENLILVMDDPVTSLDENRMRTVTNHIMELSHKLNQIVILTHHFTFANYIKKLPNEVNFYQINVISNLNTNGIFDMNPNEYLIDGLEKMFSDIEKFNLGQLNQISGNDLRKFLETYLQYVFSKQYVDYKINNLKFGERIDKLYEIGVISQTAKEKLHGYRNSLNIDSHEIIDSNVEDIRNLSIEIVEYIFDHIKMK